MPRANRPWYRHTHQRWYATVNGTQHALPITDPDDFSGATSALIDLLLQQKSQPKVMSGTLAELAAAFVEHHRQRGVSEKTLRTYAGYLRWFVARFANRAIASIAPEEVTAAARDKVWSETTQANAITTVNGLMRWAGRKDFSAPCPPKDSRGEESVITEDVYRQLLKATTGDFHDLLRVLWLTGARPSEILGLTVESINWQTGTSTLKRHKTRKKNKNRIIIFGDEALPIVRELAERYKTGHLFRGLAGRPLSLHAVVTRLIRLCRKLGIHVTSYHFRHTFATRALLDGEPNAYVAALMGHSSTRMIDRHYSHVTGNTAKLREAMNRINGKKSV